MKNGLVQVSRSNNRAKIIFFPFLNYFNNLGALHLTLKVDDVLPARIRALRSKDQGWQNVGGGRRGNGAQRNDLADRNPVAAERRRSVNRLLNEVKTCTERPS